MTDHKGCPFHVAQLTGNRLTKTRDRNGGGRESSTWDEARAYLELFHRENGIRAPVSRPTQGRPSRDRSNGDLLADGGRADSMVRGLPGGTAIVASGDSTGTPFDCATCATSTTEEEIFESCVEHLHEAYNCGKIRPMITIFRAAIPGPREFGSGIRN